MSLAARRPSCQQGLQSACSPTEAASPPDTEASWMSYASDCSSDEDEELHDGRLLAPLGEEGMIQMYKVEDEKLDVFKTNDGVGCSLKWDRTETTIYVYTRSDDHYSGWLGICLIQDGEVDTGALDDVQHAWGLKRAHPLWILPGSELERLRLGEITPEDQE